MEESTAATAVVAQPKTIVIERSWAIVGGAVIAPLIIGLEAAPPGFEDVVATINPIGDDQPDTPAHWSVTFAVEDADAAAAKATELGGEVIVPPFDAPWVRMTILADPQGATFAASRFTPENA
jgi:hypothetical protein